MIDPPHAEECLAPSRFIDSQHPAIVELAASLTDPLADPVANAVSLYYWVRDNIRYNPYSLETTPDAYLASVTLGAGEGWCVPKALLLAGLCRAQGIPARVGYADVRNHLSTERMRQLMQTDVFYYHGYTSIFLEGRWVKATPAFNIELCEKFALRPLEFNGTEDSLYHEFDVAGNRHMEYLSDRGEFLDLPFEDLMMTMHTHYPNWFSATNTESIPSTESWDADVERETGA